MRSPEDEVAAFERANRNRNRIIRAVVILIPVGLMGSMIHRCVSQEQAIRKHNRQVQADYKRAEAERRERREARIQGDVERRRQRLADPEEKRVLDEKLAEAGPMRTAAGQAFADGMAAAEAVDATCGGALSATELSESLSLPPADRDAVFGGVDLRMVDAVAASKGEYVLTPSMRKQVGRGVDIQFVKPRSDSTASSVAITSAVLARHAEAELAAREDIQRGLYPKDMTWAKPHGYEVVLLLSTFSMPNLPYTVDTPFDKTREFEAGVARGRVVVWSHSKRKVVCAAAFEARSSSSIDDIEQHYTTISGGVTQGSVGNRTMVIYALVVDFERNLSAALVRALGLR